MDVVAITGDLIDQANRYLEAIGPVERGLERLAEKGIRVLAVSGNHDHDVLPSLADAVGDDVFRLLGRRGRWERETLEVNGVRVHFDGWSFPRLHHGESPVASYPGVAPDGAPTFVLLHCDLDQPRSPYAPVTLPELRRHADAFFLLGHIHTPRLVREPGGANLLYPGSPQAMDPGERGERGVWILDVEADGIRTTSIPISSVLYETIDLDVSGIDEADAVDVRVHEAIRAFVDGLTLPGSRLQNIRCRLRVVGPTQIARSIEQRLLELTPSLEVTVGSASASIENVIMETRPAHDLESLADGIGAPAVLANLLRSDSLPPELAAKIRGVVEQVHGSRAFIEVGDDEDDSARLEAAAMEEAWRAASDLLDELIAQKGDGK